MLDLKEAKTAAKALYLQAACMSGLDVSEQSPTGISQLVEQWYDKVNNGRRPEAVANILRIIASTLEEAQKTGDQMLHEDSVDKGKDKVCPVYPNDNNING